MAAKVNRAVMVGCKPFVRSERHTRNQWNALMREYQDNIHDRVVIAAMRPSGQWYDSEVSGDYGRWLCASCVVS